ncbi:deoxyribodipyrimidine photo-lyase [Pseudoalteromonas peptidolytica]|uniref:Deoxyribodipyrimidine photo-lyase n=1 Tax=Pseudoalteromonas peptidolytica F12-50-A1 TaxID=1315280 RepID=A0A8I0MZ51_9GAMM|nr:deoxyribodipyrimidine photo-lyase [Pseudoalteromonas peptidolytica]MBE0348714.1 deoxyribodipyrimidine photo-lyase [Pseudoalteromonas peptidolytica F12-50-A1]NLR15121.1 deoxyribodipyrimidine photo-lyase [Pseudoalteromonas peptidolytica]GEK10476.1 deoxyribodipyrimidine photo-lyase [Pseudoalteromonas peptidolytica]
MKTAFWFRRDLRVYGNEALIEAINEGARDALFFYCKPQWQQHNTASIQIDLLERRLVELGALLSEFGVQLHIIEAGMFTELPERLSAFCEENNISRLFANKEYEVNEIARDNECSKRVSLRCFDGDVIAPPGTVLTGSGEMFKVFTPFKKAWLKLFSDQRFNFQHWPLEKRSAGEFTTPSFFAMTMESQKWPVDDESIVAVVNRFIKDKLTDYQGDRDFPAIKGTSGLSPYLALGIISPKQLLTQIQLDNPEVLERPSQPEFCWINEIIWREFYRHLIVAFPKLCKGSNFNEKYNAVAWQAVPEVFQLWCEGQTGYPIVDAAMRQLNKTGWMHNRLRMIVASFLTKHLLIDWRQGEAYFMSKLIDGDLASNNGGWQWAASTGCDAQPYFRIFNPITQSEKFDPDGTFIRTYVPELKNVPAKHIHFPHDYLSAFGGQYCAPIVDHKEARARALEAFKV